MHDYQLLAEVNMNLERYPNEVFLLHHNSLSISVGVCALHAVIIAESCLSFYIALQVPTVSKRVRFGFSKWNMQIECLATFVVCLLRRFKTQDVVAKEVTRLIHSDPVSFIDIPDAAQVYDMTNTDQLVQSMYWHPLCLDHVWLGGILVEPVKANC